MRRCLNDKAVCKCLFTFVWDIFRGESPWHSNDSWYLGTVQGSSLQYSDTKSILMLHEMQRLKKHNPTKCVHCICHMCVFKAKNNEKLKTILLINRIFHFNTATDFLHLGCYLFIFFIFIVNWHPEIFKPIEKTMMKFITHSDGIFNMWYFSEW